jgi:curved DNA-binding protein CbpA
MKDFKDYAKMTYYEILEIDTSATDLEIQTAFESARRSFLDDAVGIYTLFTREELEEVRQKIREAYETLSHPESRKAYDRALGLPIHEDMEAPVEVVEEGTPEPEADEASDPPEEEKKVTKSGTDLRINFVEEDISFYSGTNMKKIRDKKGITIEAISGITKISPIFLKKIEKDEYQGLPERVFVRGFVMEYAKCLKLDHIRAMEDFLKGYDEWREKNQKK